MTTKTTREVFEDIYTLLIALAGAPPAMREDFVGYHADRHSPDLPSAGTVTEWRFMGALGMGGKFWVSIEHFHVSYYPENENPDRIEARRATNLALKPLYKEWRRLLEGR